MKPSISASEEVVSSNRAREGSDGLPGQDSGCFMLKGLPNEQEGSITEGDTIGTREIGGQDNAEQLGTIRYSYLHPDPSEWG